MTERAKRRAEARKLVKKNRKQSLANQAAEPTNTFVAVEPESPVMEPATTETIAAETITTSKISAAQLAANQANAKLSTGPTSEAGRATSARNNFRHGLTHDEGALILLETESEEQYNRALAGFQNEWKPQTATEHDLVERLTNHQWLRRRSLKLQKEFLAPNGLITDEKKFALYRRYEVQHERAFNKALSDLMRLRSLQIRERNGFESQRRKEELHVLKVKAMKDRENRENLLRLEAEAKLTIAQWKLCQANLIDHSSNPYRSEEVSQKAAG